MKRMLILLSGMLLLFDTVGYAQERCWTLEECIAHAYQQNIEIKTQELAVAEKRLSLSESKWSYAPELSASAGHSLSTGRVLDPTTYNASVGVSLPLFSGLRNHYNLQRAKLDLRSSLLAVETTRRSVRLNVTARYLEVLCAEETIRDAEQVVSELEVQAGKTERMVEARKVTMADLLQIRSQLSDARNDVLTARNTCEIARLELCQLPEVESARVGIELARRDLQLARTAYWPTLSLAAGYGSSYSDARQKMFQQADGTYRYEAYPFFEQYRDNASSYVSLSLSIPIFGKFTTRKNVQRQKLALRRAEYALRTAEKQVEKEVTQALIDARTAWARYLGAQEFVALAEEAARQVSRKYDLGAATVTDYNAAVTTRVKARSQLLQAKYEYLFKIKTLTYYTLYYGE